MKLFDPLTTDISAIIIVRWAYYSLQAGEQRRRYFLFARGYQYHYANEPVLV